MTVERFSWLDRHMLIPYHTPCRRAMDKRTAKKQGRRQKAERIAILVMHAAGRCELAYTKYEYTAYICPCSQSFESESDSQRLHPLSPGVRAASPRKRRSRWCGTRASRLFPTTYSFRRAHQARASDRDGDQTASDRKTLPYGFVSRYIDSKAVCSVQWQEQV